MNTPMRNKIGDCLLPGIIILLAVMLGSCGTIPFRRQQGNASDQASLAFTSQAHAAPKPLSGGNITVVNIESGLTGGGTQGNMALSTETNVMRQHVNGNCAVGERMIRLDVAANTHSTFSQLAVIEGLIGAYEGGMCGASSNGAGSVTAIVAY